MSCRSESFWSRFICSTDWQLIWSWAEARLGRWEFWKLGQRSFCGLENGEGQRARRQCEKSSVKEQFNCWDHAFCVHVSLENNTQPHSIWSRLRQAISSGITGIYVHINQEIVHKTKNLPPLHVILPGFLKKQQQAPWRPSSIPEYAALHKERSLSVSPGLISAVTFFSTFCDLIFVFRFVLTFLLCYIVQMFGSLI